MSAWSLLDIFLLAVVMAAVAGLLWFLRAPEPPSYFLPPEPEHRRIVPFRTPPYDWAEHEDEVEA